MLGQNNDCKENRKFKRHFYAAMARIEEYTQITVNGKEGRPDQIQFEKDIEKIAVYTRSVTQQLLMNFHFGYGSYEAFQNERANWIKWYEDNKCSNLKWR